MHHFKIYLFLTFLFCATVVSCDRVKKKSMKIITTTKEAVKNKKEALQDKIMPRFDAGAPDTKFNKKRFFEFFRVYPTPDVKNLYCYADQMGIDASYWLAFECNDSTVKKIIDNLQLKPDKQYAFIMDMQGKVIDSIPKDGERLSGGLNSQPAFWWDTTFIKHSEPYGRTEDALCWYLWHDTKNNKVYFLTFDM